MALFLNDQIAQHLVAASNSGNIELVQQLLNEGAHKNVIYNSITPLGSASMRGHLEVVKLLLDHGARADMAFSEYEFTPLIIAADSGHVEIVKLLLEHGARVNLPNNIGTTALYMAAKNGNRELVEVLLSKGASQTEAKKLGYNPIVGASGGGHLELVKFLLERGANVNWKDRGGLNPLHAAAIGGHLEIVKLVMERGSKVNGKLSCGATPLHHASESGHVGVVEYLLEHGASPDSTDEVNHTPIYAASRQGHLEVVKLLLDHGANPCGSATCRQMNTPITLASQYGHYEVAKLLLQYGAQDLKRRRHGALTLAFRRQELPDFNVVKSLLERGSVMKEKDFKPAFMETLKADRLDVAELFLQTHLSVASLPVAVHFVAQSSHERSDELLKLLIEQGAKLNYIDTSSFAGCKPTALHLAVMNKQASKVWQLVLNGADTSISMESAQGGEKSVWDLCVEGDSATRGALLHHWTPQTHKLHQKWVREAIFTYAKFRIEFERLILCSLLLVSKRNKWPFDASVLRTIASFVAFDWNKAPSTPPLATRARKLFESVFKML